MVAGDEEFGPSGSSESRSIEVGPANEVDPEERAQADLDEARPDLDLRQRNISETRRPMGPPLESDEDRAEADEPPGESPDEADVDPTDPDAGER